MAQIGRWSRSAPQSCNVVVLAGNVQVVLPSDEAAAYTLAPETSVLPEAGVASYDITNVPQISTLP